MACCTCGSGSYSARPADGSSSAPPWKCRYCDHPLSLLGWRSLRLDAPSPARRSLSPAWFAWGSATWVCARCRSARGWVARHQGIAPRMAHRPTRIARQRSPVLDGSDLFATADPSWHCVTDLRRRGSYLTSYCRCASGDSRQSRYACQIRNNRCRDLYYYFITRILILITNQKEAVPEFLKNS